MKFHKAPDKFAIGENLLFLSIKKDFNTENILINNKKLLISADSCQKLKFKAKKQII